MNGGFGRGGAEGPRPLVSSNPASPTIADRIAQVLAVWFGCGYFPKAPGHAGTLGAIPLYLLIRSHGPAAVTVAAVAITAIGVWASGRFARMLGGKDPQIICVDEVAGVLVTWIAAPRTTTGLIAGFVLFRILDVWKPWPARLAERRLSGGAGIVFDDVLAGMWGALCLLGARRLGWL